VSTQRQEYKNRNKGRTSQLNEQRIRLLNDLNFAWEVKRGRRHRHLTPTKAATVDSAKDIPGDTNCILPRKTLLGSGHGVPNFLEAKREGLPVDSRSQHAIPGSMRQQRKPQQQQQNETAGFQMRNGWHSTVMADAQQGRFVYQRVNPASAATQLWSAAMGGIPQQRADANLFAHYASTGAVGGINQHNTVRTTPFSGHGGIAPLPFGPGAMDVQVQQSRNSRSFWHSRLDPPPDPPVNERHRTRETTGETIGHQVDAETEREEKPPKRIKLDP
jgi:hypothetical protein